MQSLFKKKNVAPAAPKEPAPGNDPAAPRTAAAKGLGSFFNGTRKSPSNAATTSKPPAAEKEEPLSRSKTKSNPPSRKTSEKHTNKSDTLKSNPASRTSSVKKTNFTSDGEDDMPSFPDSSLPNQQDSFKKTGTNGSCDSMEGGLKRRPSSMKMEDRGLSRRGDGNAAGPMPLKSRPSIRRQGTVNGECSSDSISGSSQELPLRARPSLMRRLQQQDGDSTSSMNNVGVSGAFDKSYKPAEMKAMLAKQRQDLASLGINGPSTRTSELHRTAKEFESGRRFAEDPELEQSGNDSEKDENLSEESNDDPIKETVGALTPERLREKWRWAFEGVKRSMGFKAATKDGNAMDKNLNNLTSQLSSMANPVRMDNQKTKLLEILSKPVMYRSAEQLYALNLILKNFPSFARYSRAFRMKLVEKGFLLEYGAYRVIVRQNGTPWNIYFLLSGKCQSESVVVRQDKGLLRRKDIVTGEAFGEFGMLNPKEKRSETVYTMTPVVLLAVPRDVYVELMQAEAMANKAEKISVLRSIPGISKATPQMLDQILSASQVYSFEPNTSLLRAGDRNMVTIILEGQCRASRLVPFLVKSQDGDKATTATEITNPLVPGTPIPPGEEVVYHNLSIGLLSAGEIFPRIALQRSEGLEHRLQKVELNKIIMLMNVILRLTNKQFKLDKTNIGAILNQELDEPDMDLEDSVAGVDLSVISADKVTCLVISKMDLVNVLTEDILAELIHPDSEGLVGIPIEEIQQNYLNKIQWNGYRNQVVQGVLERRASTIPKRR